MLIGSVLYCLLRVAYRGLKAECDACCRRLGVLLQQASGRFTLLYVFAYSLLSSLDIDTGSMKGY